MCLGQSMLILHTKGILSTELNQNYSYKLQNTNWLDNEKILRIVRKYLSKVNLVVYQRVKKVLTRQQIKQKRLQKPIQTKWMVINIINKQPWFQTIGLFPIQVRGSNSHRFPIYETGSGETLLLITLERYPVAMKPNCQDKCRQSFDQNSFVSELVRRVDWNRAVTSRI